MISVDITLLHVNNCRCEEDNRRLGANAWVSTVYELGLVVYVGFHRSCISHGQLLCNDLVTNFQHRTFSSTSAIDYLERLMSEMT